MTAPSGLDWMALRPMLENVRDALADSPGLSARIDGLGAYVRDSLDTVGLTLADETTAFHLACFGALTVDMAANGLRSGLLDDESADWIRTVAQVLAAVALPAVPDGILG